MLRGGTINKHLRIIEALLPNSTAPPLEAWGNKKNEEVEFIEAHPLIMPRWKICLDLLQIMIIYFDAIQTLTLALKSKKIIAPGGSVNIKVLFQPPLGKGELMLNWMELL